MTESAASEDGRSMTQSELFTSVASLAAPCSPLTCRFGEPWGPGTAHPLCEQEIERMCQQFDRDVAAGIYSPDGHKLTKNGKERKG